MSSEDPEVPKSEKPSQMPIAPCPLKVYHRTWLENSHLLFVYFITLYFDLVGKKIVVQSKCRSFLRLPGVYKMLWKGKGAPIMCAKGESEQGSRWTRTTGWWGEGGKGKVSGRKLRRNQVRTAPPSSRVTPLPKSTHLLSSICPLVP